jgi:hypothetical protein
MGVDQRKKGGNNQQTIGGAHLFPDEASRENHKSCPMFEKASTDGTHYQLINAKLSNNYFCLKV